MLKLFGFIPQKPGWTRDEWLTHYRERHGPLVAGTSSFSRRFAGYAQNYALAGEGFAIGVSELWIADAAALADAFADGDYLAQVRPDEHRFTDQAQVRGGVGIETVVKQRLPAGRKRWARQPLFKLFLCHWAAEGVSAEAYAAHWRACAQVDRAGDARGYTLMLPVAELSPGADGIGAIEEYWFDSAEALAAGRDRLGERANGPSDSMTARSETLAVRHHRVFG